MNSGQNSGQKFGLRSTPPHTQSPGPFGPRTRKSPKRVQKEYPAQGTPSGLLLDSSGFRDRTSEGPGRPHVGRGLSGPNRAMQPRCAMRFESHTPKSLAMRNIFSLAMRKPITLISNHKKIAEKSLRKSCDVGLRCEKSACFLRSSDAKCLRFRSFGFLLRARSACACDAKSLAMRVERCEPLRAGSMFSTFPKDPAVLKKYYDAVIHYRRSNFAICEDFCEFSPGKQP